MPPAEIVAAALALLDGPPSTRARALCPSCAAAPQGPSGMCGHCSTGITSIERQRAAKRAWWATTGSAARRERRAA